MRNGETFVSDDTSRSDEAFLDKSDIRNYICFEFIVNMLYNNEVCRNEGDKQMKMYEIISHLKAQGTELNLKISGHLALRTYARNHEPVNLTH